MHVCFPGQRPKRDVVMVMSMAYKSSFKLKLSTVSRVSKVSNSKADVEHLSSLPVSTKAQLSIPVRVTNPAIPLGRQMLELSRKFTFSPSLETGWLAVNPSFHHLSVRCLQEQGDLRPKSFELVS